MSLAVVDGRRQSVLAGGRRLDRLTGCPSASSARSQLSTGVSTGLALGIVSDLQQLERPFAGDRLVGEGLAHQARLDRVADAVMTAIDPGIHAERLRARRAPSLFPRSCRRDWSVISAVIS